MRQRDGAGIGDRAPGGLLEVFARVDAGQLGTFDQRVEERGDESAAVGARAVVVLAPNGRSRVILPMSDFVRGCTTSGTRCAGTTSRCSTAKRVAVRPFSSASRQTERGTGEVIPARMFDAVPDVN